VAEVEHDDIESFVSDKVNLPSTKAQEHRDQVNRLREGLQKKINADPDYSLVKMLHAGSVAKGTALKTVNDLDVAVYVQKADVPDDDSALVPWLAERLFEAAPANMAREQFVEEAHCVTVSYKGSGLDVDVVPVLYEGEADDVGCLVNRHDGRRMLTSITLHLKFIRSRKKEYGTNFAQLIRLTKWWRRQAVNQDHPDLKFKSFMIELLWAHLADNGLDLSDYPTALEAFFQHVVQGEFDDIIAFTDFCEGSELPSRDAAVPIEVIDPVNPDNNVAVRYDRAGKALIVDACTDAFDALTQARFATSKTRAVDCWQTVLGPSFRG
jgi:tRNA nucleotidyltransferase (CCA-adding enzyme)